MDEEVLGPPAKMLANREELTPMMSQYCDLCEAYDDSLVLFQVGDFYETFCEAAEATARLLEITLTKREDSSGRYPMSGVPTDDAASYVETLLEDGYRVAIADQVEDPDEASGVVERAVTRVVTPGTVVDDELLSAGTSNYLGAVVAAEAGYAVAFIDVSTGEFRATSGDRPTVQDEIDRFDPAEAVVGPGVSGLDLDCMVSPHDESAFEQAAAREQVTAYVDPGSLEGPAELRACGAVLSYAEFTQGGDLDYVTDVVRYDPREFMRLDRTALRSLELFDSRTGGEGHTLFDAVDETSSALGRRTLRGWIRRPLVDRAAIEARHDAVEELAARSLVRPELRELLQDVYDLERLVGRVSQGRANARDLRSLLATLDIVPEVRDALADAEADRLRELRDQLDELGDVRSLLRESIREEPPVEVTEGEVIREGFDPDLDSLRRTEREGREWVADLEAREQERTGIDSLAVGYNEVHGYYIEVTDPNLDRVPDDYTRRQTLKNSERFYTPELKEREDEILGAAERADSLEYELFVEVREAVAAEAERVQTTAAALSALDALATLAEVAVEHGYSRPTMGADGIEVEAGRHPVVERTRDPFVPNDTDLTDERFAVVTGPNMSGKSTYMRQVALIAVLAQAGSFVPADAACLPVFDRVFTRVGASDDLAGGQSTFMREMAELTEILHHATEDSLVLLDEVGRGTSTTDGLSIAWATTEYVHDEVGAFTLFATHYHELTDAAAELPGVQNLHFVADREGGDVTFLHTVREGASEASYGVDVADLAGVPDPVVERARSLMECGGPTAADDQRRAGAEADGGTPDPATDSGQEGVPADVVERLREIEVAETTPLEALNELQELTRHVDN